MFTTSLSGLFSQRRNLVAFAAALIVLIPAFSQTPTPGNSAPPGEYSVLEVNAFAGYQWFQIYATDDKSRVSKFDSGPVVGIRVTEDFSKYVGFEQSFTAGFNDLRLRPFGLQQFASANAHNYALVINPVLHFTKRESKVRPFVTAGPGLVWYVPSNTLQNTVAGAAPLTTELKTKYGPALMFGGGVKFNASRRVGLRFDLRDTWTQGRYFGLPDYPYGAGAIYSPAHGTEHSVALTGGISFRFGHRTDEVPVQATPVSAAPAPPPPAADVRIAGISGARDVCPGDDLRLDASASGWLPDQTPTYQWIVSGQPVAGANGTSFNVPTMDGPGTKSIAVRVSVPDSSRTSDPVTVRVKDAGAPVVRFALSQTSIPFGTKLPLNATAEPSECGGAANIRYSASEGTIAVNIFDSSTVGFDLSNRLKQQTKVIHLTATATDSKGGTGSATSDITVVLTPEARRLDDIVYPAYNARVNNCAKRLLLEQLTPMLRQDPNATVILIGHRDEREKGPVASRLDRMRTLNAAAVLSAGSGICPQLELSRVKVNWVGTDQSATPRPLLCGPSTDVKERRGQAVKTADQRVQFRRVEVWIVPGGAAIPSTVTGLKELPASEIQRLGCPK